MSDRAPYSRIYWSLVDDPKFHGIYDVDSHFAAWVRLLMAADAVWPASAHLPAMIRKASLRALADCELIDLLPGHRYRIRGLDAERRRRQTGPKRDPYGSYMGTDPKAQDKTRLEETSKDETSREGTDPGDIYWRLTGRYPTDGALSWIDKLANEYGAEQTARALAAAHVRSREAATLLSRSQDILRSDARKLTLREREAEGARLAEIRARPKAQEPWLAEFRDSILRQYADLESKRGDAA